MLEKYSYLWRFSLCYWFRKCMRYNQHRSNCSCNKQPPKISATWKPEWYFLLSFILIGDCPATLLLIIIYDLRPLYQILLVTISKSNEVMHQPFYSPIKTISSHSVIIQAEVGQNMCSIKCPEEEASETFAEEHLWQPHFTLLITKCLIHFTFCI